jgi:hypothetical protein
LRVFIEVQVLLSSSDTVVDAVDFVERCSFVFGRCSWLGLLLVSELQWESSCLLDLVRSEVFAVKKMVEIIAKIHLYRSVVGLLHRSLQSEGQEDRRP